MRGAAQREYGLGGERVQEGEAKKVGGEGCGGAELGRVRLWWGAAGLKGRAKARRRQELGEDPHVEDMQTVALGAGRPAHLRVAAHVRDTPDLLAAWRLGARQTTPR